MSMPAEDVVQTIRSFLVRINKDSVALESTSRLYGDGIGLDSLEAAELSALLEDRHGRDPFSDGAAPETVGDILDFYR